MESFGGYLKEQRESKSVSLKDISHTTKITERYLDFIEKDKFDKVPGGAYITGYISSYASFIGMDARETLERFDSFRKEKCETEYKLEDSLKPKVKWNPILFLSNKGKWVIVTSIILTLVTLGAISMFLPNDKKLHVFADIDSGNGKESQINNDISSKDSQSLENNSDSISHEEIKNIPKENKYIDNKMSQEVTSAKPLAAAPHKPAGQNRSYSKKHMKVSMAAACKDVQDKNPFGKTHSFQWSTDRVYIWNLIESKTGLSSIRHIYYFEGEVVSDIALDIRSSWWRTWSYKALSDKRYIGNWRVDITSADGNLLESVQFEVS